MVGRAAWWSRWRAATSCGRATRSRRRSPCSSGTADEGLRDGGPGEAFFAQPSGLAADGDALWVADAESSALRTVDRAAGPRATTAVGQGLFDFGLRDGPAFGDPPALLQHPLGVAVLPDGSVAVADTYNGAVRHYDPATRAVSTLADGPGGADRTCSSTARRRWSVVESAAHRLVRLPLPARLRAAAGPPRVTAEVAPGPVTLRVRFSPPEGQHVDRRFGEPTSLTVTAPDGFLPAGAGTAPGLERELRLDGPGLLRVDAVAAACDGDGVFAACHRYRQEWAVDVRCSARGGRRGRPRPARLSGRSAPVARARADRRASCPSRPRRSELLSELSELSELSDFSSRSRWSFSSRLSVDFSESSRTSSRTSSRLDFSVDFSVVVASSSAVVFTAFAVLVSSAGGRSSAPWWSSTPWSPAPQWSSEW